MRYQVSTNQVSEEVWSAALHGVEVEHGWCDGDLVNSKQETVNNRVIEQEKTGDEEATEQKTPFSFCGQLLGSNTSKKIRHNNFAAAKDKSKSLKKLSFNPFEK